MGQYFKATVACSRTGVPWDWWRVIWLTRAFRTLIAFAWWVRFRSVIGRFPLTTLVLLKSVDLVARRAHILSINEEK